MRIYLLASALLMSGSLLAEIGSKHVPTTDRDGRLYVSRSALESQGEIALKCLPGADRIALCAEDRCATVKDFVREGSDILVPLSTITETLGLRAHVDQARKSVRFELIEEETSSIAGRLGVGQLAPDFRLATLDGKSVALSDFRGKRVLINSWASW